MIEVVVVLWLGANLGLLACLYIRHLLAGAGKPEVVSTSVAVS